MYVSELHEASRFSFRGLVQSSGGFRPQPLPLRLFLSTTMMMMARFTSIPGGLLSNRSGHVKVTENVGFLVIFLIMPIFSFGCHRSLHQKVLLWKCAFGLAWGSFGDVFWGRFFDVQFCVVRFGTGLVEWSWDGWLGGLEDFLGLDLGQIWDHGPLPDWGPLEWQVQIRFQNCRFWLSKFLWFLPFSIISMMTWIYNLRWYRRFLFIGILIFRSHCLRPFEILLGFQMNYLVTTFYGIKIGGRNVVALILDDLWTVYFLILWFL